jgi:hypothetical protein
MLNFNKSLFLNFEMTLTNKIYCWRLYLNQYSNETNKNFNQIKLDNIGQISMSEQTCHISDKKKYKIVAVYPR